MLINNHQKFVSAVFYLFVMEHSVKVGLGFGLCSEVVTSPEVIEGVYILVQIRNWRMDSNHLWIKFCSTCSKNGSVTRDFSYKPIQFYPVIGFEKGGQSWEK
ncbi:MAG: hypothetical protein DRN19_03005 [Thermoplasmata archaeon]|nr:MAG: hypothetical protein DRN19_03005 [Thermoplasmata archaeon]